MPLEPKNSDLPHLNLQQNGAYSVTLCVHGRRLAFGKVTNGVMQLSSSGQLARDYWLALPRHFPQIQLDEFVFMPNHMHGIVWVKGEAPPTGQQELELRSLGKPQSAALAAVLASYRKAVTKKISELRGSPTQVWEERFSDRVIRYDDDLNYQRTTIRNNPTRWANDDFYLAAP